MTRLLSVFLIFFIGSCFVNAQSEAELKEYFEGKTVILKIDMPATKDGVNLHPYKKQAMDYNEYGNRVKRNGIAIRKRDSVMITKVKVSGNHVEFQLGGGGYGTFGDDTSTSVYVPAKEKSKREKQLEEDIKKETDVDKKKRMKEELEDLKDDRESEDSRNQAEAAAASELKRQHIEEKALQGGSRFNIHFEKGTNPGALTPKAIENALEKYVHFSEEPSSSDE